MPAGRMRPPEMNTARTVRRLLAVLTVAACFAPFVAQAASVPGKPTAPKATTGGTAAAHGSSATLTGAVDPGGAAATYSFEYGPTIAYGKRTTPGKLPAGTSRVKVGQPVSGLLAGYHYRLLATNEVATAYGKDRTFGVKKNSSRAKFTLPKTSAPTVYGGTYVLSGTLAGAGNAGRALVLQASPFPFLEAFTTIGLPVHTDAAGRFSFHVAHLLKTTQFRVATLDPRPFYSHVTTQQVAVKVTLKVRSSGSRGLVRLYGTVTPAKPGAHLDVQLFKAVRPGNSPKAEERTGRFATQFSTLVKKGTASVSRFSVVAKIARGGSYRAYVSVTKRGTVTSGTSPTLLLHAAPSTGKRH